VAFAVRDREGREKGGAVHLRRVGVARMAAKVAVSCSSGALLLVLR